MKFTLTPEEAVFLYKCVFNPAIFNFNGTPFCKAYSDKDYKSAKMTTRIKDWFNKKVSDGKAQNEILPKEKKEVTLKQVYAEHLTSILKHYEADVGLRTDFCDVYISIIDKLEGKESVADNAWEDEAKKA